MFFLLIGAHVIGFIDMMIMPHHIHFQNSIKANFNVHILSVSSLFSTALFCVRKLGARILFEMSPNPLMSNNSYSEKQSNEN